MPADTVVSPLTIEEAALRAWPAAQQLLYDGWVARLSDGYTKRANSASLLYPQPNSLSGSTFEAIETLYRSHGLPVIFRLLSFSTSPEVERMFEDCGYRTADGTLVMTRPLDSTNDPAANVRDLDVEEGVAAHARMNNLPDAILPAHRHTLERIPGGLRFCGLFDNGKLVACALSVTDGSLAGLFDIVTDPAHRRRGHGARLVNGMMSSAARQGARTAYLQVVERNLPAIQLYRSLGFAEAYRYSYRVLD